MRCDRLEHRLHHRLDVAVLDEAAAQLVDDRDVLDADGADLDASPALGAGPQRVGRDGAAVDRDVAPGRAREVEDQVAR